ncbi:MAG: efflux RND transporter permease subunit [Flavobacteriales bacterium]
MFPTKWRQIAWSVLAVAGVWTGYAGYRAAQLVVNYDFEQFFPSDDPETAYYRAFRDQFATDNDFVLIALESEGTVYDAAYLGRVDALTDRLLACPHVVEVISPTRIAEPLVFGGSVFKRPLLRWDSGPDDLRADSIRIARRPDILGNAISTDQTACAIVVQHAPALSAEGCDALAASIDSISADFPGLHATGRALAQRHYIGTLRNELILFVVVGLVLLTALLYIAFRSWVGVVAPIGIVLLSAVWTLGILHLAGGQIDIMTVVMPTLLFVVGVSDVVHILARFNDEQLDGHAPTEALRRTYREVGLATFLTSATTAIGFLTLLTAAIAPVRNFGLYTAIGVGVAYICAFTVLPAILVLFPPPPRARQGGDGPWDAGLGKLFRWTFAHGQSIALGTGLIVVFSIAGTLQVETDTRLLEDLTEDDPLRKEFSYFEAHFAGVRPFELAIEVPAHLSVFNPEVLRETEAIAARAEQLGAGAVMAPSRVFALANRWKNGDAPSAQRLPDDNEELTRLAASVNRGAGREALGQTVVPEAGLIRIAGRTTDDGARAHALREAELLAWHATAYPRSELAVHPTGTARLIDLNNADLTQNLTTGIGLSIAVVSLLAGFMFRNFAVALIAALVNLLPIAAIAGWMGFANIDLKVSTGIVFCIAFGIAVDDTIHFLSRLRLELSRGVALPVALRTTHRSTGKAIVLTSIILCAGFSVLTLSDFAGTVFLGASIAGSLAVAVALDLLLLPWLLLKFYRPRRTSAA